MGKYGTTTTTTWNINPRASNTGNLTAFGGDSSSSSSGQESQAHYIIGAQTACMVVALVLVALRTYTRTIVRPGNFGWEDVLLVASMAAFVLESACVYQKVHDGDGQHVFNLVYGQISAILEDGYLSLIAYMTTICLVKLSLITQYHRIFIDRHTRIACHVSFYFTALFSLSTILASIFSCTPVTSFWNWESTTLGGRQCINYYALWYAHGAVNIFTDFIVLLLPVPAMYTLNLPLRQKISSGLLFAFGSFGCIASIVRLYELWYINNLTMDTTYSDLQSIWCAIELAVCVICASVTGLPPLYYDKLEPLLNRILGRAGRAQSKATGATATATVGSGTRGRSQGSQGAAQYVYPYPDSPRTSRGMDSSSEAGKKKTTAKKGSYLNVFSGWKAGRRGRTCGHSIHSAGDDTDFASSAERSTDNVRMGNLAGAPDTAAARSRGGGYAV